MSAQQRQPRQLVELDFVLPGGQRRTVTGEQAADVAFEHCLLSRTIPVYVNQQHTCGIYWAATGSKQLPYESYLECQWMTLLDFDPDVVGISSQPFRLRVHAGDEPWQHYPDFFVRLADGSGKVIDVKNPEQLDSPDVQDQAGRTRDCCEQIGWRYELVSEPDPVLWRNVEWLAGYRGPINLPQDVTEQVLAHAAGGRPLEELCESVPPEELARAAVYRLLWQHRLLTDLSEPLRDWSLIRPHHQEEER